MSGVLNMTDACHLASIVRAAQGNKRVARLVDGYVYKGTARSVSREDGTMALNSDDIRDLFLRVTLPGGVEAFWPVRELMSESLSGVFVAEYAD